MDGFTLAVEDYSRPIGCVMPYIAAALGSRPEKQFRDALIAEGALRNNLALVTADRKLARVAQSFGAYVERID